MKLEKAAKGGGQGWEKEQNEAELKSSCSENIDINITRHGRHFELVHFGKTFTF